MPLICSICGRDIDTIHQVNMSDDMEPICEDCYYLMQKSDKEFYEIYSESCYYLTLETDNKKYKEEYDVTI